MTGAIVAGVVVCVGVFVTSALLGALPYEVGAFRYVVVAWTCLLLFGVAAAAAVLAWS